jgi:palmitoyl transferase
VGRRAGRFRYNEEGNWSALFAMMFKDSHNEWQPAMGYGWEKGWYLDNAKDFRLGLGAAAGITARDDFANYVPLPLSSRCFRPGISALPSSSPIFPEPITTATCSLPGCA